MSTRRVIGVCLTAWSAACITGCASTRPKPPANLPHYDWSDAATALRTMEDRDHAVDTFSASCDLLVENHGKRVALTGAVAADPPDRLRLRAWKLSQAVLDLTLNEDGLFLYQRKRDGDDDSSVSKLTEKRFVSVLKLLPGFGATGQWTTKTVGRKEFSIVSRSADGPMIECFIDKRTLTRTRCVHRDDQGHVGETLTFTSYRPIDGTVWPMHLAVRGLHGNVDLDFDDVNINEELSPRAFKPPRRAVKQP